MRKGVQREALWPTTLLARCSGLHNTCACGGGCDASRGECHDYRPIPLCFVSGSEQSIAVSFCGRKCCVPDHARP